MCVYILLIQLILLFVDLRILVVGSSIIRTAFCQKRHSIVQTHLELEMHLATIFSQGKVGMKWGGGNYAENHVFTKGRGLIQYPRIALQGQKHTG